MCNALTLFHPVILRNIIMEDDSYGNVSPVLIQYSHLLLSLKSIEFAVVTTGRSIFKSFKNKRDAIVSSVLHD